MKVPEKTVRDKAQVEHRYNERLAAMEVDQRTIAECQRSLDYNAPLLAHDAQLLQNYEALFQAYADAPEPNRIPLDNPLDDPSLGERHAAPGTLIDALKSTGPVDPKTLARLLGRSERSVTGQLYAVRRHHPGTIVRRHDGMWEAA